MAYKITNLKEKIFELVILGDYQAGIIEEARTAFLEHLKQKNLTKEGIALLVNLEQLKGTISKEQRTKLAKDFAKLYKGIKTAVFSPLNYQDYFFEQTATSLGLLTLTFNSRHEALKWLEGDFDF